MEQKPVAVVSANLVDHSERAAKVSQLAGELTELMAAAFKSGTMSLGDVVYAGGLGINGFTKIAAMLIDAPDMTDDFLAKQNLAIITEALGAEVQALRCETVEQARMLTERDPSDKTVN
ncbi:MAG: hypothetical protein ACXWVD_00425 [Telluria sp.]